MEAIIKETIGRQGFEIVQERIVLILLTELKHQRELQPDLIDFNLFSERSTPVDQTEPEIINICLGGITYDNRSQASVQGTVSYNIDVYAKGKSSATIPGDLDATNKSHRLAGVCRYILSSTKYNALGFENQGLIGGTHIESIQPDPISEQDTSFIKMCRLVFVVKIQEDQELWKGVELSGINTSIKLELTDKGYKYELNQ